MNSLIQKDFILAPGEEFIQCPYNQAHIVTNAKFIVHLTKCRREYEKEREKAGKRMKMQACRFNDTHIVITPEIKFHEERCPDRFNVVETIRYHKSEEFSRKLDDDERRRKEDRKRHKKSKKHKRERERRSRSRSSSSGKDRGGSEKNGHNGKDRGVERVLRISLYPEQDEINNMNNHHHTPNNNGRGGGGGVFKDYGNGRAGGMPNNNGRGGGMPNNNGRGGGGGGGVFKDYGHGHIDHRFRGERQETRPPKKPKYDKHIMYNNGEHENIWGEDAEDWDAEAKGNGEAAYDPPETMKNKVILYQPGGLSKSERKQYRLDQKLKAARLADSGHDSEDDTDRDRDPHPVGSNNRTEPHFSETNFTQVKQEKPKDFWDDEAHFKYEPTTSSTKNDYNYKPVTSTKIDFNYEPTTSKKNHFNYEPPTSTKTDFNYEPTTAKKNDYNYEPTTSAKNDFNYKPITPKNNNFNYESTTSKNNAFNYEPTPVTKLDLKYEPPISPKVPLVPPPKVVEDSEKEDGECTDEEFEAFIGEDPFS